MACEGSDADYVVVGNFLKGPLPTIICGGCWERQLMTDRTLDLTNALREAQLQRLEASLSAKCATPSVRTQKLMKEKVDT